MPLYLDRHDVPGASREETARAHAADLAISGEYGVEFLSYWHDPELEHVFCFARAARAEAVTEAHNASHGLIPSEVIEVSESDVVRFLGAVKDPADASEVTSAFRIISFTDLVGSTELLDRVGQAEYMVLLTEHDLIVRKALVRRDGREVKHTGDGLMVVFDLVDHALAWALDVAEAFAEHPTLEIRIGIAAGEPVDHDHDLFGAAVNTASRICSVAGTGQVFVSDVVHDLGVAAGFGFDTGSTVSLKGFSAPATVYRLMEPPTTDD